MGAGLQRAGAAARATHGENTPAHAVNQRWRDNDTRRDIVREVVILELAEKAKRSRAIDSYGANTPALRARCAVYRSGVKQPRETWIACARLIPTSSGYTYVGEGPPPQMPGSGGSK